MPKFDCLEYSRSAECRETCVITPWQWLFTYFPRTNRRWPENTRKLKRISSQGFVENIPSQNPFLGYFQTMVLNLVRPRRWLASRDGTPRHAIWYLKLFRTTMHDQIDMMVCVKMVCRVKKIISDPSLLDIKEKVNQRKHPHLEVVEDSHAR